MALAPPGFWSKKSHEKAEMLAALKSFVSLKYAAGWMHSRGSLSASWYEKGNAKEWLRGGRGEGGDILKRTVGKSQTNAINATEWWREGGVAPPFAN